MKRVAFALFLVAACIGFVALGVWQMQRLSWKQELIANTENRLAQPPVDAPTPAEWGAIDTSDLYTKLHATGHYLSGQDTFVVASTRYGRGFWVLTPFMTDAGFTVLVNRGFILPAQKATLRVPAGAQRIEGLLRLSEPQGSLLQQNQPAADRWYARDVAAIASARGLAGDIAPYFIDLATVENAPKDQPIAGLTVVQFRNNHLQYALTWFALAALALVGMVLVCRPVARASDAGAS